MESKTNLKDFKNESFNNIDSYKAFVKVLDSKNSVEIEKLNHNINKNDIVFELYDNNLLTNERLQYIMNYCTKYFSITSKWIKKLIKNENVNLLDIIFSHFNFYDNNFILQFLFHYKNKIAISTLDLNQLISNEKFKISIKDENTSCNTIDKYLENECNKKNVNIDIIKYLVDHEQI